MFIRKLLHLALLGKYLEISAPIVYLYSIPVYIFIYQHSLLEIYGIYLFKLTSIDLPVYIPWGYCIVILIGSMLCELNLKKKLIDLEPWACATYSTINESDWVYWTIWFTNIRAMKSYNDGRAHNIVGHRSLWRPQMPQ